MDFPFCLLKNYQVKRMLPAKTPLLYASEAGSLSTDRSVLHNADVPSHSHECPKELSAGGSHYDQLEDQRTPCTLARVGDFRSAGESSLIGGSFFLSRNPCIFGVVSKAWLALLPLHYDSLELTAEIFPSRVPVFATTSFRNYLAINHSKYRPLDRIQHLPQPTC